MIDVDEKFKFGPSGPYPCSEKMEIPIKTEEGSLWVTVSIVKANIPMLLGNNILKPLGAQIKLLKAGNGILKVKDVEIKMRETKGGHYTIEVSDLGKLGVKSASMSPRTKPEQTFPARYQCDVCDKCFWEDDALRDHRKTLHGADNHCYSCGYSMKNMSDLKKHKETLHGLPQGTLNKEETKLRSVLKKRSKGSDIVNTSNCSEKVVTDLNTLINSKPSKKESTIISILKELSYLKHCSECEKDYQKKSTVDNHTNEYHDIQVATAVQEKCSECKTIFQDKSHLKNHLKSEHESNHEESEHESNVGLIFLSHHQDQDESDEDVL